MNSLKYEALISSAKTAPAQIQQLANQIQQVSISIRLKLLVFLEHSLGCHSAPHVHLNSVLLLLNLLQKANSWEVSLVQNVFLESLKEPALVAAIGSNTKIYDYFENKGHRSIQSNLQTLSYHFTHTCLAVCLLVAYIKPKKLYKSKQLNVSSIGKTIQIELRQKGLDEGTIQTVAKKYNFISLKKLFVSNVISFHKNPHFYISFFMDQMEKYILTKVDSTFFRWFKLLARDGDVYISSQALARAAEIMCFHKQFSVRRNSLNILSDFVFWGDLEALLLINYTQYFKSIGERIIQAQNRFRKTQILCFFPQIQGQTKQKQLFLNDFLLCVRRIATLFPTLETYFVESGEAPLYQLYVHLLKRQVRFPVWQNQEHFNLKVMRNFKQKKQHNAMFLEQLDKQKREVSLRLNPLRPTMKQLIFYCQKNRQNLGKFMASKDENSKQWVQLIEFRKVYEDYLERMVEEGKEEEINNLIEECIYLDNRIQDIQVLSYKYKEGKITKQVFRQCLENQMPSFKRDSYEDKASSLRETLRSKDRDSDRYTLTPSAQAVVDKLNAKMLKLAYKRGDQVGQVSQLQLYSRPFLANNIHGKDMTNDFLPIFHLHPLRKEKRNRKGLKLMAGKEESISEKSMGTPRFVSEIKPRQKLRGIKLASQQNRTYDRYLTYLQDETIRKFMVRNPIKIYESDKWIINRSQTIGQNLCLQTVFYCTCPGDISTLKYRISDQSWLEIKSMISQKEYSRIQIKVTASFTKFGFKVPTIDFEFNQEKFSTLLPFVLHNFLTITPLTKQPNKHFKEVSIPHPLRTCFSNINQIASQLRGMKQVDGLAQGRVHLGKWQCDLGLKIQRGRLSATIGSDTDKGDNILEDLLPRLITYLYTNWRQTLPS